MIVLVVAMAAVAGWLNWSLVGGKSIWRDRFVPILVLLIGTTLCVALMLKMPIPYATDWIEELFKPVYTPIMNWLKEAND